MPFRGHGEDFKKPDEWSVQENNKDNKKDNKNENNNENKENSDERFGRRCRCFV
eukprot:CAMPEP_0194780350 /NCGR_PEP_ID=MMETSP0323_2-20130528/73434_1 /TAXON_ID=2866 ORGANISM="Crypthecodinium cohnii, Strain Seligo" /NCGR_SAMPLE_ID=MMETSP0323_2 /ASSEMBLY_ACC=CAM_ASM_000346 /LENGTH=53 /DNA_ID=CAMNT_0039718299 /DNA_START=209 /DNA_END=371 /DNA_ORIENTATION=-